MQKTTFAAGCFWGVEAEFKKLKGVRSTTCGYTGGQKENPTYKEVCTGKTGHAEAVEIEFDENVISFEELLNAFWNMHDPTTLNRQGPDVGSQYRSAIFYFSDEQKKLAENSKESFSNPKIVTEIIPAEKFWPAEDYHQDYFDKNHDACCHTK